MPEIETFSEYSHSVVPVADERLDLIRGIAKEPDEVTRVKNATYKHHLVFGPREKMKLVSDIAIDSLFHPTEAPYIRPHFDTRGNLFQTLPGQAALNYSRRVTRRLRDGFFESEEEQSAASSAIGLLYDRHIARQEETFRNIEVLTAQFGVVAVIPSPLFDVTDDGEPGDLTGFRLGLWLPHEFMVLQNSENRRRADVVLLKTSERVDGRNVVRWLYYDDEYVRVLTDKFEDCTNASSLVRFSDEEREHGGHGARSLPVVFFRDSAVYNSFYDSCAASDMLLADSMKALALFADASRTFHASNFGVDVVGGDLSEKDEARLANSYFTPGVVVRLGVGATYQRVNREVNVANISKPVDDLLRDVAPRYGQSYDETRLIATQSSGLSRFLAREKLHDYVKSRRPLFRAAEAELFALMCGYIVDAGDAVHPDLAPLGVDEFDDVQAIPEMAALRVEYEDFKVITTAYEDIAAQRAEIEAGTVSAADLLARAEPGLTHDEALDKALRVASETAELKRTATPAAASPFGDLAAALTGGAKPPAAPVPGGA